MRRTSGQVIFDNLNAYEMPSNVDLGTALKIIWRAEGGTDQYSEAEVLTLAGRFKLFFEDFENVDWSTEFIGITLLAEDFEDSLWISEAWTNLINEDFENIDWITGGYATILIDNFENADWTTILNFSTILIDNFENVDWGT